LNNISTSLFRNIDQIDYWFSTESLTFSNNNIKSLAFSHINLVNLEKQKILGYILKANYPDSFCNEIGFEYSWFIYVNGDVTINGVERDIRESIGYGQKTYIYYYNNILLKKGWNILSNRLVDKDNENITFNTLVSPIDASLWYASFYNSAKNLKLSDSHYVKAKR
jgi:hypothetical protein